MAEFAKETWDWWMAALAAKNEGKNHLIGSAQLPIREDPMTGIYRMRSHRDGPFIPIQFWYNSSGELRCDRGGKGKAVENATARGAWHFAAQNPITEARYVEWQQTGKWWDEDRVVVNGKEQSSQEPAPQAEKPKRGRPRKNAEQVVPEVAEPAAAEQLAAVEPSSVLEKISEAPRRRRSSVNWDEDDDVATAPAVVETASTQAVEVETSAEVGDDPSAPSEHHISEKAVAATVEDQEEHNERAAIGGNNPPDEFAELKDSIEEWARLAERLEKAGLPKSQDEADRLADVKSKLGELWALGETMRKTEKKPHDDASDAVQAKFKPLLSRARVGQDVAARVLAPYLRQKEDAEKERVRLENEANKQAVDAGEVVRPVRAQPVGAGTRRKVSQTRRKVGVIEDLPTAAAYFASQQRVNPEFKELVRKLGERVMIAGSDVPGMKLTEETSVR